MYDVCTRNMRIYFYVIIFVVTPRLEARVVTCLSPASRLRYVRVRHVQIVTIGVTMLPPRRSTVSSPAASGCIPSEKMHAFLPILSAFSAPLPVFSTHHRSFAERPIRSPS